MARSLNKATILGNVGSDPEVRTTTNGGKVASFSLATSNVWTDASGTKQEKTEWHRCVAWNAGKYTLADIVERYVKKGEKLYIEGEITYRQWEDKDGQARTTTEIKVRELILLGGKAEGADPAPARRDAPVARRAAPDTGDRPAALEDDDDGLPF